MWNSCMVNQKFTVWAHIDCFDEFQVPLHVSARFAHKVSSIHSDWMSTTSVALKTTFFPQLPPPTWPQYEAAIRARATSPCIFWLLLWRLTLPFKTKLHAWSCHTLSISTFVYCASRAWNCKPWKNSLVHRPWNKAHNRNIYLHLSSPNCL